MTVDFHIKPDEVKNLSTTVADRLTDLIQAGDFKPGQRLVQTELAKQFGVSRVAIRDALQKLLQRGLALDIPLKGMIVQPVSLKTVQDLFEIRQALESLAVRLACDRLDRETLAAIEAIIKRQEVLARQGDIEGLLEQDWQFHQTIYRQCDNEPLVEMITGLWARIRQARGLARDNPTWGRVWATESVKRHKRVFAALKRKDGEQAAKQMSDTIGKAFKELVDGLKEGFPESESQP